MLCRFSVVVSKMNITQPKHIGPINANAGALLLHKYQEQWQEMHSNTVHCTRQAEVLSKKISQSCKQCDTQCKAFTRMCSHLVLLRDIQREVESITVAIGRVGASLEEVKSIMAVCENLSDENDAYDKIQDMKSEMQNIKLAKKLELENVKADAAQKHAEFLHQQSQLPKSQEDV